MTFKPNEEGRGQGQEKESPKGVIVEEERETATRKSDHGPPGILFTAISIVYKIESGYS